MEGRQEGKINIKINKGQIITERFRKELRVTFSSLFFPCPPCSLLLSLFFHGDSKEKTNQDPEEEREAKWAGHGSGRKK